MKNKYRLPVVVVGAISMMALVSGFLPANTARADEVPVAKPASMFSNNQNVSGVVTAKTSDSLTVGSTVVFVTDATAFIKDGQTIKLDAVQVGDHVNIEATSATGGKLQAVSVKVVSKQSGSMRG